MTSSIFRNLLIKALHEVNPVGELIKTELQFLYAYIDIIPSEEYDVIIKGYLIDTPWIKFSRAENNTLGIPNQIGYYIINQFDTDAIIERLEYYQVQLFKTSPNENGIYFNIPITKKNDNLIDEFCKKSGKLKWRHGDYPFEDSDQPFYGYHLISEYF